MAAFDIAQLAGDSCDSTSRFPDAPWHRRKKQLLAANAAGDSTPETCSVTSKSCGDGSTSETCSVTSKSFGDGTPETCSETGSSLGSSSPSDSFDTTTTTNAATLDSAVRQALQEVKAESERVSPDRVTLRECVERAVNNASSGALADCHVEVVGSTSWGCDIAGSDLDLVLVTAPCGRQFGSRNNTKFDQKLLEALRNQLQNDASFERIELRTASRVPILWLRARCGLSCDISVDQRHALAHRDVLLRSLRGQEQLHGYIRLVKLWLSRRALPTSSSGGISSIAWVIVALRLAEKLPRGTSIKDLLKHFFQEMSHLGQWHLTVERLPATTTAGKVTWARRQETGRVRTWAAEWLQFFWVDDPAASAAAVDGGTSRVGITAERTPTALCALYLAELRRARRKIEKDRLHELWEPVPLQFQASLQPAAPSRTDSECTTLHLFLQGGNLHCGKLLDVQTFERGEPSNDLALHRRDMYSELTVQPSRLRNFEEVAAGDTAPEWELDGQVLMSFNPHHWVCAIPSRSVAGVERMRYVLRAVKDSSAGPSSFQSSSSSSPSPNRSKRSTAQCQMQQQSVGAHCTTPVMMMMMPAQQTSTTTSQPHSHADTSPVAPVMMNNNIGNMMGVPMAMCTFAQPMTYVAMIAIPNAFPSAVAANIVPTSAATPP